MSKPRPMIIDISEHQVPSTINYDLLANEIDGVIIRVQYGSNRIDKFYINHITEFKKRGIPIAIYAWVRGISNSDMEIEATDFYNRAKEFEPDFWWLDIEEQSMNDMRTGCEKYRLKLKELGAKKVGVYIANHLYKQFNINTSKFDGVWIPTYGVNNGEYIGNNPTATNDYDIHQYTSKGRLNGYPYDLDLNRIVRKEFDYFFSNKEVKPENKPEVENGGINVKTITTTVNDVKLRSEPKVGNNIIAGLPINSSVKINDIVLSDGIVWGVQPRANGQKGYIDLGKQYTWVK